MCKLGQNIQIECIPLDRIDLTDTQYKICREEEDITALALAIKERGLASVPLVRPLGDSYTVVLGLKQIKALVHNQYTGKLVCQTTPLASELDYAMLAISDLAFQRQLTPAELIQSLLLLGPFMDPICLSEKAVSLFNTRLNPEYIQALYTIGAMPPQVLELLDAGSLSIKSARRLSTGSPESVACFLALFSVVKSSTSKQMEIITHFLEICAREKLNPMTLFQQKELQEILAHPSDDPGFKGDLLRRYLIERRFPVLEKKRRDIQKKIKSLGLEPGMKLGVPENFEGMTYTLGFEFQTRAEFDHRVKFLDRLSDHPALQEILER